MSKQPTTGPSLFDIANQQYHNNTVGHSNIASGQALNGGNTINHHGNNYPQGNNHHPNFDVSHGQGLDGGLGSSQSPLSTMLQSSKIAGLEGASVDAAFRSPSSMGENIFAQLDDSNFAPLTLSKEPLVKAIQSEKIDLHHVSVTEQTGAKIEGNTGIMSPSQGGGQQH
jgi:hypothetical protein